MLLDHTIVPAKNKDETARFFTDILGFEPGDELPDAQFVHVNDTLTLRCDEKYSDHVHLAFYVTGDELAQVTERAKAAGTPMDHAQGLRTTSSESMAEALASTSATPAATVSS